MAEFNEADQKLNLKLVYYGPALSGKTTNLTSLHQLINPQLKGEMMVLETKNDRTLFFDLLPLGLTTTSGLTIKVRLFTVPGQVSHDSTRKAVLSRADGVIFVADSQLDQARNNLESFENLAANIARVGLNMDTLPIVIQYNKRDLDNIVPEQEIIQRWQQSPWPLHFSSALKNQGVLETFKQLLASLYPLLDKEYQLQQQHQLDQGEFIERLTLNDRPDKPRDNQLDKDQGSQT